MKRQRKLPFDPKVFLKLEQKWRVINCNRYRAAFNGAPITPVHRAVEPIGAITSRPVLGGLHHQYCRN